MAKYFVVTNNIGWEKGHRMKDMYHYSSIGSIVKEVNLAVLKGTGRSESEAKTQLGDSIILCQRLSDSDNCVKKNIYALQWIRRRHLRRIAKKQIMAELL
jgi:hypothetical protein